MMEADRPIRSMIGRELSCDKRQKVNHFGDSLLKAVNRVGDEGPM
jgi:hypothetical protein